MKRIIISEEEKKHILSLYNLLTEDIDSKSGGTSSIDLFYKSGFYTLDGQDTKTNQQLLQKISEELNKVRDFLLQNPNSVVTVKFESQESAIPNKDMEGKSGGGWLEVGDLSDLRKEYFESFITNWFNNLKSQGQISDKTEIKPLIYEKKNFVTPWVGQKFCPSDSNLDEQRSSCIQNFRNGLKGNDSEIKKLKSLYDSEQNTKIIITVEKKEEPDIELCTDELEIRIWVPGHKCQNAEFFVFANQTLLYNSVGGYTVNLNNDDVWRGIPNVNSTPIFWPEFLNPGYGKLKNGDGTYPNYGFGLQNELGDIKNGRSDTFILTKDMVKNIVGNTSGYLNLWLIATTSTAHKDIVNVTIKSGETKSVIFDKKPNVKQGRLLRLNICTGSVELFSDESVPSISEHVNKLRNERIILMRQEEEKEKKDPNKKLKRKEQKKLDSKGLLLERAQLLIEDMRKFLVYIKKSLTYNPSSLSDVQNEINNFYDNVIIRLKGDKNNISLLRTDGANFDNQIVNNDELFGDVRDDMNIFYEGFDAIYWDDGETNRNGIRKYSNYEDAGLDVKTILKNIKSLENYIID
jgi:hypothetical protein